MTLKIIDQFGGRLVRDNINDMNSGLAKYPTTFGSDPFTNIGNLTWQESAIQIDPTGSVITDLIVCGKERVESGISYVYAVGHTGRVYKIQVNDPNSFNANYDNPILLTTLSINSPTFTRGGSLEFYGTTERMYIGHDVGVTQLDFTGTNETFIGSTSSWVQNIPRPVKQFVGKLYYGNGNNIAEIDSTLTVTSYTKLSPGFPYGTQVRDLDVSIDGNYLEAVVSRLALPNITATTQDTTFLTNSESYLFKWNGTDIGYTSGISFPTFSLNCNIAFGNFQYTFGYDQSGAAVFNPTKKILSPLLSEAPLPNAVSSNGNQVNWMVPESSGGFLKASYFVFGALDAEVGVGWWRQYQQAATGTETDVLKVPFQLPVSNVVLGASSNGYANTLAGNGKMYFSTLETSAAPTVKYKLYKFFPVSTGSNPVCPGVYETQQQTSFKLFRQINAKKFKINALRLYTEPLVAGNSFKVEFIGAGLQPMAIDNGNTFKIFTVGTNCSVGDDHLWFTPSMSPTFSIGLRFTNLGTTNWVLQKAELDYDEAGV